MAIHHRVYLIPGFLGFTRLGDETSEGINYFQSVPELLGARFEAHGIDAKVYCLAPDPTSDLATRASTVLHDIEKTEPGDHEELHLVGHSTGGLDARAVAALGAAPKAPAFLKRVRSVVTISTPHHGTPLATFFERGGVGKTALRYLWLFTYLALHRKAMPFRAALLQAIYRLVMAGDEAGIPPNLFTEIAQMMAKLSDNERQELLLYFEKVGANQKLIHDLTPAGVEAFNPGAPDREGVRYGCIVTGAPHPSIFRRVLLPPDSLIYGLFCALYDLSAPQSRELKIPERTEAQTRALRDAFGEEFESHSDGIVPSRSQVWGQVLHVVKSDHLDVVGHFDQPPRHVSWLKSGSHFKEEQFRQVWERAADFMAGWPAVAPRPTPSARKSPGLEDGSARPPAQTPAYSGA